MSDSKSAIARCMDFASYIAHEIVGWTIGVPLLILTYPLYMYYIRKDKILAKKLSEGV